MLQKWTSQQVFLAIKLHFILAAWKSRINPQGVPSLRRVGFMVCCKLNLDYCTSFSSWDHKWKHTQRIWHCIFNTFPLGKEWRPMPFSVI
jgi:hypothetical protein